MINKLRMPLVVVAAFCLFSGLSYASQPGNMDVTIPGGDGACAPPGFASGSQTTITGVPITISTWTANGDSMAAVTAIITQSSPSTGILPAFHLVWTFNLTAGTYTSGVPNSGSPTSGKFTGSITTNSAGGFVLNITLGCGTKLQGATEFVGS